MQFQQPDGNLRALNEPSVHGMDAHTCDGCSFGGVTCQPFPPVRGFGILSGVSHHKSYTVIVGGSMSPKAFPIRTYVLVCCKIGWRQVDFSWAYPFTGRDSKESEHIQIIIWDRRYRKMENWMQKSQSACRTVRRTGRESV